jgi:hypothetical protein
MFSKDSLPSVSSPPASPVDELLLPRTTIIISNLNKNDFILDETATKTFCGKRLSLADQIKLIILNLENPNPITSSAARGDSTEPGGVGAKDPTSVASTTTNSGDSEANHFNTSITLDEDYYLNHIEYWTNLPFLNRIIVIFKDEQSAQAIYNFLNSKAPDSLTLLFPHVKVSQKENLLSRSKSFDSLIKTSENLSVTKSLSNFKNLHNDSSYNEPEPKPFNVIEDLSKIGIDLNQYNNEDQIDELRLPPLLTPPPGVKRTRSLTKTLFKPDLSLDTTVLLKPEEKKDYPASPTITLDESN